MAKIYIIPDHPGYNRTILGVADKWREQGHEVQLDMYYDVNRAEWCDVIFGEYIQGGVVHAMQDPNLKKPIVIRGIDIDLYFGHYLGLDWNKAKAVLFITDYMKNFIAQNYISAVKTPTCQVETVKLGIDLSKWTFRDRSVERGKTIGWINNFWSGKGIELLCQLIYKLVKADKEYKFEIVGQCHSERWLIKYFEEFCKRNGLWENIKMIDSVVSVDEWMNGIDYILSTSMKECMSLPMAEAMAKGIKPVIHHWWDAKELYPAELVYETVDEAFGMITDNRYDSKFYRKFIEDNYSLDKEVAALNKILNI